MVKVHDFNESLAKSHAAEDLPFWRETYEQAFPKMRAMVNHREDGDHQRAGIDRSIILENSTTIRIDEKVRYQNSNGRVYEDIALEFLSNKERKIKGWVNKPLLCDYIAYAIAPLGVCYLMPVVPLQAAWLRNSKLWACDRSNYRCYAKNRTDGKEWTTVSLCVPAKVVMMSIHDYFIINFKPVKPLSNEP